METKVEVPMADGARVAAFVLAPPGVADEPGTPFGVTWDPAPVVVLHGNGESHEHMAQVTEALARERSAIAIDTRGHGASARGTAPLTYERLAADVLEVMSRLGVTQAHVLGFSDGGITGLLMARDSPGRILSLTCLGANLSPEGMAASAREDMRGGLARMGQAASQGPGGRYETPELLRLMLEQPHIDPASLAAVACPTCVMAGEHDLIEPRETERIAGSVPGARLVVVSGAGHDLPLDAPGEVVAQVRKTMGQGEPARRHRPLVERIGDSVRVPKPACDVCVVRATVADEGAVLALYERLLDACDEPGRETCGWRRGFWPLPHDVSRRVHEGTTWVALDPADVAQAPGGPCARPGARVLGAMSLDGDFGLPGVEPDWDRMGEREALTCHLLASDPGLHGRGIATALLAAYAEEALSCGCRALRINTSPQSGANALYHELGFTLHKPVYFPYEGLGITPWTNPYELRLDGGTPAEAGEAVATDEAATRGGATTSGDVR